MGGGTGPGHRLRIQPELRERFPSYAAFVIYAHGVENAASGARPPSTRIWPPGARHTAPSASSPAASRTRPEALLTRVLRGDALPAINRLVDLYNAVSLKHGLPVGGEDLEQVSSDPTLCFARGGESFDTVRSGAPVVESVPAGEVVWLDSRGVTCRAWNWRQGVRTRLTESTRHAYFVLDRLEPYPLEALRAAGEEPAGTDPGRFAGVPAGGRPAGAARMSAGTTAVGVNEGGGHAAGIGYKVLGVAALSGMDALGKRVAADYSVFQMLAVRSSVAIVLVLLLLSLRGGLRTLRTRQPLGHARRSLCGLVAFVTFYTALRHLPLADAVAIAFGSPFLVTALAGVLLKEPVSGRQWLAIGVGFLGMLLVVRPSGAGVQPAALLVLVSPTR